MTPLSGMGVAEAMSESPSLTIALDGRIVGPRASEHCSDFGDCCSCGAKLCVGGDETYKGVFVGHSLRLGYVVGVGEQIPGAGAAFTRGEAFKTLDAMLGRWVID